MIPMKICLQSDQYSDIISGIGTRTRIMADELSAAGHDVVLICSEKKAPKGIGFEYEYVPSCRFDPNHAKWFSFAINTSRMIGKIYEKHRFDVFHSLDAREGSLAARKLAVPTIGNMNDYYFASAPWNPAHFMKEYKADWLRRYLNHNFGKIYERLTLNSYDRIVVESDVTKEYMTGAYGIPQEKIEKIHEAVSCLPDRRNAVRVKRSGDYVVLMVGTGLQRKGIFYLIRAAPRVLEKFPNARFVVVGRAQERIKEEARKLGVLGNFEFRGKVDFSCVPRCYRQADVFILPSLIEGFGITVLEAFSYGVPCIGSRVGGMKESIIDGWNGLHVEPGNSAQIAEAIIRLISDPVLRERLSRNAYGDARKRFGKELMIKKTLKLYEKMAR